MRYTVEVRLRRGSTVLLRYPCESFAEAQDLAERENQRWGYDYQVTLLLPPADFRTCSCTTKLYCSRYPATKCKMGH